MFSLPEITSGLLCGVLFGFVLESAGFGSPSKLTAQFRLSDWSVFKVMFTAIVVAAVGLTILTSTGLMQAEQIFVPQAFIIAAAIGGALVGAGFAVGGYCPGTSVVGFVSGRVDAAVFLIGLVAGTFVFSGLFQSVESLTSAGEYAKGDTISQAFGISPWLVDVFMVAGAVFVFWLGTRFERKSEGPVSAKKAVSGSGSH